VTEEEIRSMAEVGHEEGVIDAQERELIHAAFTFGDTVVREVMVPRPDMITLEIRRALIDFVSCVLDHGHSRVPIYRETPEQIEGIVYVKDVLSHLRDGHGNVPLRELMRPAIFVPESKRVAELLKDMQRHKFHMAVVTDEFGTVSGVVTLEDLLEELVGEIADEWDREERELLELGPGRYRAAGSMSVHDLNKTLGVTLPSQDWDTLGGLVLGLIGVIPREGQEVRCDRVTFKVEKMQRRRVASVLLTVAPETGAREGDGTAP
jgi:CBS domain containing-hemolysin-like protein